VERNRSGKGWLLEVDRSREDFLDQEFVERKNLILDRYKIYIDSCHTRSSANRVLVECSCR
jgi:hypothetical protein